MNKELLLTKIESELTIKLMQDDLQFFKNELERHVSNKESILSIDYKDYKENEKEECFLEDTNFFKSMISSYEEMLTNDKKFDAIKKDYFLVNAVSLELIYIRLETELDINEDYLRNIKDYKLSLDDIEYVKRIIAIYKNIFRKIYELELLKINKEEFDKHINN